jgi:ABC-type nickel/cobalt efflux system permease component RcnA
MNYFGMMMMQLAKWQAQLNHKITTWFKALETDPFTASVTVLSLAFLYGLLHAAGPGHGKSLIMSWFLRHKGKPVKAVFMGFGVSLVHATSALALTLGVHFFLKSAFFPTQEQQAAIATKFVSGILIILVGCYLIYEFIKDRKTGRSHDDIEMKSPKNWSVILAAGVVPCPGVSAVLFFSLAVNHLWLGVMAALAMSLGMGFTIAVAGIFAVYFKSTLEGKFSKLSTYLSLAGVLFVLLIGAFLVTSSVTEHQKRTSRPASGAGMFHRR